MTREEAYLETAIDRYAPAVASTARAGLAKMRKRFPGVRLDVYDRRGSLPIGFAPADGGSPVMSLVLYPRWVRFFFLEGVLLNDPEGRLEGSGSQVRSLRVDERAAILDDPLRARTHGTGAQGSRRRLHARHQPGGPEDSEVDPHDHTDRWRSRAPGDTATLGPKLTPSKIDCDRDVAPVPAPLAPGQSPTPRCTMWVNYGIVRGFSRTMPQLARALDDIVGAPVVDRTGLSGYWDFDVQWQVPTPNDARGELRTPPVESIAGLFAALQDRLGLKLTATRGPVDVLVIESVSRPTPN